MIIALINLLVNVILLFWKVKSKYFMSKKVVIEKESVIRRKKD